jgi:hypothetical protein
MGYQYIHEGTMLGPKRTRFLHSGYQYIQEMHAYIVLRKKVLLT